MPQGAVLARSSAGDGSHRCASAGTVDLIISKGVDLVDVPDVVGMTVNEATAELEAAGFVGGRPRGLSDAQRDPFKVTGTDPSGRRRAPKRGSGVTVTGVLASL